MINFLMGNYFKIINLNSELKKIKEIAFDKCYLLISNMNVESEGKAYKACNFEIDGFKVICRNAKITPKKIGQFVTFWKRNNDGETEPYHKTDEIDFYVVNVMKDDRIGQFVLPKSVLIEKKIVSSEENEGKRGFRVYPSWDTPLNKRAQKTQKWQVKYFIEFDNKVNLGRVKQLYQKK